MHRVLVFGGSGYSGLELLRLLASHPAVELRGASSDKWAGRPLRSVLPLFSRPLVFRSHQELLADAAPGETAFFATPAKTSLEWAPRLLERGLKVIDLSGAFRLDDAGAYPSWYGFAHTSPALLGEAQYGLPELVNAPPWPKEVRLVANPGCYATAAILALAPLLAAGLLDLGAPLFVDGKSGSTGAGRSADEALQHAEVAENLRPYRLLQHQHTPEIERALSLAARRPLKISFAAHLVPMRRGLLVSAYARAAKGTSQARLAQAYADAYQRRPFVRVLSDRPPETLELSHGNAAQVHVRLDERTSGVLAFAALDNLVKGAAGQAVQNMNRLLGLSEELGLVPAGFEWSPA